MTTKELAHSIIDGFTEKQLKGFVSLFIESEPEVDDRDIDDVIADVSWEYANNCSDPSYQKRIDDRVANYLKKGCSDYFAHLYAYHTTLTVTIQAFKYVWEMLNKGVSLETVAENLEVSPEEAEKMAELLRAEKLVE